MAAIKIAVLGHWGANIGHDLMSAGIEAVARETLAPHLVAFDRYEQHRPFDIYPAAHPLRLVDRFRHQSRLAAPLRRMLNRPSLSRAFWTTARPSLAKAELALATVGPALTPGIGSASPVALMLNHVPGAFQARDIPVLNLSIGSCFPWERYGDAALTDGDIALFERCFQHCAVSTVRDTLAQEIFARHGHDLPLIPCPALACWLHLRTLAGGQESDDYIVVNFQDRGSNQDWGQQVDSRQWTATVGQVIRELRKDHRILLVCHDAREEELAARLDESLPRTRPNSMEDYARIVRGAKIGFCSRVHAAIPLASAGVASLVIGTDTRLLTVQRMGLPIRYVKDANAEFILSTLNHLLAHRQAERERLIALRHDTVAQYGRIILEHLHDRRQAAA